MSNKTLIFKKAVPAGQHPVSGEHLVVEARPFDPEAAPPPGGLILRTNYASFDPYQRLKMRSDEKEADQFEIDAPVDSFIISTVVKSNTPDYVPGDIVSAYLPIAEHNVVTKDEIKTIEGKVHNAFGLDLGLFLGPLGMPGLTAYSSLYDIGEPKKGQTIFVTSAAGAVGQLVGQLAKNEGLKVIGSVGSDDKLDFIVKELGLDCGFNYKKEKTIDALRRLAPDGIDIFYDNVGGEQFEAALLHMNQRGRVVISGAVSQYHLKFEDRYGIKSIPEIDTKCLRVQGFLVWHLADQYRRQHQENVQKWLSDGSIQAKLHENVGIDTAADGLVGMLQGKNFGKAILRL